MRSHLSWGGERSIFYKGYGKPLPNICVLKTLRKSLKGKAKEDNIYPRRAWAIPINENKKNKHSTNVEKLIQGKMHNVQNINYIETIKS